MKHWLYSLCCTIHPCSLTPRSLYLPLPSPYMPFPRPPHWQPLVCSLYPTGSTSRTKLNDNLIREMNNYIYIYIYIHIYIHIFFFFFTYLLLAVPGLHCYVDFVQMQRAGAPLPLWFAGSSLRWLLSLRSVGTRCFGSCGGHTQLFRSKWDLPRPRIKPVFPASAGRFFNPEPLEKP